MYEIRNRNGHYELWHNGELEQTADTRQELEEEIEMEMSKNG